MVLYDGHSIVGTLPPLLQPQSASVSSFVFMYTPPPHWKDFDQSMLCLICKLLDKYGNDVDGWKFWKSCKYVR